MKIVADESIDKQIVDRPRSAGHDVLFIAELDPGIDDDVALLRSRELGAVCLLRTRISENLCSASVCFTLELC